MKNKPLELLMLYTIWKNPGINKYQLSKIIAGHWYPNVYDGIKKFVEMDIVTNNQEVNKKNQLVTYYSLKKEFVSFEDLFLWYIESCLCR